MLLAAESYALYLLPVTTQLVAEENNHEEPSAALPQPRRVPRPIGMDRRNEVASVYPGGIYIPG